MDNGLAVYNPVYNPVNGFRGNIVSVNLPGTQRVQDLYCEAVNISQGFASLTKIRKMKMFYSTVELMTELTVSKPYSSSYYSKDDYHSPNIYYCVHDRYKTAGYQEYPNLVIPASCILNVVSYETMDIPDKPAWVETSKEEAIEFVNKEQIRKNESVLEENKTFWEKAEKAYLEQQKYEDYQKYKKEFPVPWWAFWKFKKYAPVPKSREDFDKEYNQSLRREYKDDIIRNATYYIKEKNIEGVPNYE